MSDPDYIDEIEHLQEENDRCVPKTFSERCADQLDGVMAAFISLGFIGFFMWAVATNQYWVAYVAIFLVAAGIAWAFVYYLIVLVVGLLKVNNLIR